MSEVIHPAIWIRPRLMVLLYIERIGFQVVATKDCAAGCGCSVTSFHLYTTDLAKQGLITKRNHGAAGCALSLTIFGKQALADLREIIGGPNAQKSD